MKRSIVVVVSLACLGAAPRGQAVHPYLAEAKQNYTIVKNNLVRAAEKMPEAHYGFKPVGEIRSFAEAVAHVADSQARSCALVNGDTKTVDAASKKTKSDLIAALQASYAMCDAAFDALTDATAGQMVRLGQSTRERSKFGLLFGMTSHSNEQYGYMAVYMRLKGIVPPSTEG